MSENLLTLPIALIDEPRVVLRQVLRQSKEYRELRSSIEDYGLLTSVLVRPKGNRYELVAGNWRRTACVELKRDSMPCIVREMTDEQMLSLQLQENAIRFDTKPAEYANQLKRLMDQSPGMTFADIAKLVKKHPNWIKQILELPKLPKEVQQLIDRGEMTVKNAVMLCKIPLRYREEQFENARRMPVKEFEILAAAITKQFVESVRQGKLDAHFNTPFKPQGYARKNKEVQAELDDPQVLPLLIVSEGCKSYLDAALVGLRWGHHQDRESVEYLRRKAELEGRLESDGVDGIDA